MGDALDQREKLQQAIAAQESLRATLGDAVVEATIAALRQALAALDQPSPAAEERKQITVLFADVSGFTAMSETMDAEDVRNTMNDLWERLDAAISKHGGQIDKHIGDAVMALFGAATAQEDDPERAVRAALQMQRELGEFAASSGRCLRMRIGIHCGPVLLGAVGSKAEFTAMGDAVNLASRLEHAAPVGGILISSDVRRQTAGLFDLKELEPIQVKGKKDPVQVYVVERAKPRPFRRSRADIETPMIGREAEFKALQDAFFQAREDREAQMITLVGEAGVGKSRLLYEFNTWSETIPEGFWYFMGRASPQTDKAPFSLLKDILSFRFGILENDSAAAAREKLERGVAGFFSGDAGALEKAHFIGQLIGLDFSSSPFLKGILGDAPQIRDRALSYLGQLFAAAEAKHPVVILVEDIHWADERSLDALAALFETSRGRRLMAVCLARPSLFERRPSWGEGQAYHRRIDLGPLSKIDTRRLIGAVLGKVEDIPQTLKALIVEEAGGNPFYVEELIRMLFDEGVIVKSEGKWLVEASRLTNFKVPSSLVGVLQARLDSLPAPEREAIQKASVVGRTFWDSALERLMDGEPEQRKSVLDAVRAKEMIFHREHSVFTGCGEYIFKHALLRDVAYESVLKRLRPEYHAKVAQWLAATAAERAGEFSGLIAEHFEKAGQNEKAAEYLALAGARALRISALREAQAFFERALKLLPSSPDEALDRRRGVLLLQLGEVHSDMGDHAEARIHYERSLESTRLCGDLAVMTSALNGLTHGFGFQGDYGEAQRRGEEGLVLARRGANDPSIARSLRELAAIARYKSELPKAKSLLEESISISRRNDDSAGLAHSLRLLGIVFHDQGSPREAKTHYEEAIKVCSLIGDRRAMAYALNCLGSVLAELKSYKEAESALQQAIAICGDIGDKAGPAHFLDSLAALEESMGQDEQAREHCIKALSICQELKLMGSVFANLALLARLQAKAGDARRAFELAGLILDHPSSTHVSKERAEAVLKEFRSKLGEDAAQEALSRGKTFTLEDVVRQELRSGRDATRP